MPGTAHTLTPEAASRYARLVLAGLHREYPSKLDHVLNGGGDLLPPSGLHPAFFGCFDWHSAVHGHWVLARVLRQVPGLPEAGRIRATLATSLSPENIAGELAYLARPGAAAFERTYGWAWLLKLAEELGRSGEPALAEIIAPLAAAFVGRYLAYLPRADYPIRAGAHANTAFGLAFAHDYARVAGHGELRGLVESKANAFYLNDADYPAHLEPGGADFLSPALMEADLMRRVLGPGEFTAWFAGFLPGAAAGRPASLFEPAHVSDRADPQIVHLDGLNLARAWCMRGIALALSARSPLRESLEASARRHAAAALPFVTSGEYVGGHWLATFAVLALTGDS